jgi:hypothetical protein
LEFYKGIKNGHKNERELWDECKEGDKHIIDKVEIAKSMITHAEHSILLQDKKINKLQEGGVFKCLRPGLEG